MNLVYQSALDVSGLFSSNSASMNLQTVYTSLYFHLKSQRTILQLTLDQIQELKKKDSGRTELLEEISKMLSKLLDSTFGDLTKVAYETVEETSHILATSTDPELIEIVTKAFTIAISIYRNLVKFCSKNFTREGWGDHNEMENKEKEKKTEKVNAEGSDDYVICRICEEKVPVTLIEEHTRICFDAYNYEAKIVKIDEKIFDHSREVAETYLSVPWPGDIQDAVKKIFPILNFTMLMEDASLIESRSLDSVSELDFIGSSIYWMDVSVNKTLAKKLLLDKIDICTKIGAAREVLSKTRVSGSEKIGTTQPCVADFQLIKRISSGAYATVFLAKKKNTGDIFAIKVIPKTSLQEKNQLRYIMREKDILIQSNNPFITNFYYSIIGKKNLYLVMEYIPGGDLFSLLQNMGLFDEESAKIYTFQMASALKHLFQCGIIHRDLKPDNILVSKEGFLKLADFGLSYIGVKKRQTTTEQNIDETKSNESLIQAKSIVGTPDYISPEMILGFPHSFTTDYWSLGVIVYEMLTGETPFHEDTEKSTYERIVKGIYEPLEDVSDEAKDFVSRLLITDQKKRLGSNGPDEILNHPWLKGLTKDNIEAPWVPELEDDISTENFEDRHCQRSPLEIPSDIKEDIASEISERRKSVEPGDFLHFKKFSKDNMEMHRTRSRRCSDVGVYSLSSQGSDDDLAQFPAIHVAQLVKQNENEAMKLSRSSYSGIPLLIPPKKPNSRKLASGSKYLGLAPSSSFGGRPKARRNSFMGSNAVDDSILRTLRTSNKY